MIRKRVQRWIRTFRLRKIGEEIFPRARKEHLLSAFSLGSFRRKIFLKRYKKKLAEKFHKNKLAIAYISAISLIVLTAGVSFFAKGEFAKFYPASCLGGWQNPKNAEGEPDLSSGAEPSEFNETNSSQLEGAAAQIFCGSFQGEIPKDTEMKTLLLKVSWTAKEKEQMKQEQEENNQTSPDTISSQTSVEISTTTISISASEDIASSTQKILDAPSNAVLDVHLDMTPPLALPSPNEETKNEKPETTDDGDKDRSSSTAEEERLPATETPPEAKSETDLSPDPEPVQTSTLESSPAPAPETPSASPSETPTPSPADPVTAPVSFLRKVLFTTVFAEEMETVSISDSIPEVTSTPETTIINTPTNDATTSDGDKISTSSIVKEEEPLPTTPSPSASDLLEVLYTLDGTEWHSLGKVSQSDWKDEFKIPVSGWDDISKLQVSIQSVPSIDEPLRVYLDGMWLEAEYEKISTEGKVDEFALKDLHRKTVRSEHVFNVSKKDFTADEDPVFGVYPFIKGEGGGDNSEGPSFMKDGPSRSATDLPTTTAMRFWFEKFVKKAIAQGTSPPTAVSPLQVASVELLDGNGRKIPIEPIVVEVNGARRIKIPRPERQFSPGRYILRAEFLEGDTIYTADQEFTWGVLVINVNKSIYRPGERAYIQMAALNENGHTLCHEPLELTVTDPGLSIKTFSTEDGSISSGPECGVDNVTDAPDYFLYYTASTTGTYLLALTDKKTNHTIESKFYARANDPFEVERIGAVRINPWKADSYTMHLKVKANQDFSGSITEAVPAGFKVTPSEEKFSVKIETDGNASTSPATGTTYIAWDAKNVKAGDTFTLSYMYTAPKISPQIHLLGPLQFTSGSAVWRIFVRLFGNEKIDFEEARQWQIASDAVNTKIRQEINILDSNLVGVSGVYATSSEIVQLDTTQYTSPTYYFEIVAENTSVSASVVVTLRRTTGAIEATITVPTLTTEYTRFRSSSFTPPAGQTNYVVTIDDALSVVKDVNAARIIILQDAATLSNTETQIEIGNNETFSNTATTTFASPKYWYYDSTKWDGSPTFYAEVTWKTIKAPFASSTTFTGAGTFNITSSPGTASTSVGLWGGGGSGGGASTNPSGGDGGAGGQFASSTVVTNSGSAHTIVVAATTGGGTGNGTRGATSTWDTTIVVAGGGNGGISNGSASTTGDTIGCVGTLCFAGGNGGKGNASYGAGGGGGAGTGGVGGSSTGAGVAGTGTLTGGGDGGAKNTTSKTSGNAGTAAGGGGGGAYRAGNGGTINGGTGAKGKALITEYIATTTIALQEDDGSFGTWTDKIYIVSSGGAGSATRARSAAFTPTTGRNYRIVERTSYTGAVIAIYNAKIIVNQTNPTLFEPQYLIANTKFTGTSLAHFNTLYDSTEWSTTNTYLHEVNSVSGGLSDVKLQDTTGPTDITGSTITDAIQREQSSALTMPPTGRNMDVIATTNNGDLYSSRILVQAALVQVFTESDFRWYQNTNAVQPGVAIDATNTAIYIATSSPIRLRTNVSVAVLLATSTQQFTLQWAYATTSGSTWTDVSATTSSSGTWKYYHNPSAQDGATTTALLLTTSNANETYQSGTTTRANVNALPSSNLGEWDFALDPSNATGTTYYFRMAQKSTNHVVTAFDTYTNYPSVSIVSLTQRAYIFLNDNGADVNSYTQAHSAATSSSISNVKKGERLVARIQIDNTGVGTSTAQYRLQYDKNDNTWVDVATTTEIRPALSTKGALWGRPDGVPLATNQVAACNASAPTYQQGRFTAITATTTIFGIGPSKCTEIAYAIETSGATLNQMYRLRVINGNTTMAFATYSNYPTFTIEATRTLTYSKGAYGDSASTTVSVLEDTANNLGRYTSIAIGADGYPVIAYNDDTNDALKFIKCNDSSCSSVSLQTLDATVDPTTGYVSIAIGTDGYPAIAYYDDTFDLGFVKCNTIDCTDAPTPVKLDTGGSVGSYASLAIGTDGYPVIAHHESTLALKFYKCNNISCSSGAANTLDNTANVGSYVSLAIGTDGYPVMSYRDESATSLKFYKCNNISCSSGTASTLDNTAEVGYFSSLAIGTDGYPVMSYRDVTNTALKFYKCNNISCSSGTESIVDNTEEDGNFYSSIAIGTDGYPVISYYDDTNKALKFLKCNDPLCSSTAIRTLDNPANQVGVSSSLAIGTDGYPVITYRDVPAQALKLLKCNSIGCYNPVSTSVANLPSDSRDFRTYLDDDGYTNVATSNDLYDSISAATSTRLAYNFKKANTNSTDQITVTWEGQVSVSTSTSLQIYNNSSGVWDTIQTNTTPTASIDFTLTGSVTNANYFDGSFIAAVRAMTGTTTAFTTLKTDRVSITFSSGSSLTLITSTDVFGTLTPGSPKFATTTLNVTTTNSTGWNVTLSGNNKTNSRMTMNDTATNAIDITDLSPQYMASSSAATTTPLTGFVSAITEGQDVLAFRVMSASGSTPFRSTSWWGSDDTPFTNAKWAGIASSTNASRIGNSSVSAASGALNTVQYYLDVSETQQSGAYSGVLTYTAAVNP